MLKRAEATDAERWMDEIAASGEAPEWLLRQAEESADHEPQPWHGMIFRAFDALRFDRFYGAMGGQTPISYAAISRYCDDYQITQDYRPTFTAFLTAVDYEYLEIQAEKDKAEKEHHGGNGTSDASRNGRTGRQGGSCWSFRSSG